jgi:hypothetical protein
MTISVAFFHLTLGAKGIVQAPKLGIEDGIHGQHVCSLLYAVIITHEANLSTLKGTHVTAVTIANLGPSIRCRHMWLSFAKRGLHPPKRPCEPPTHFSSSGLRLLAG